MYQVSSSAVFSFVSYMHIHVDPFITYCLRLFVCCFPRNELFTNMMLFIGSQSFIVLPSFMFVNAAVSEICELNQNKKEGRGILKLTISNLRPFLGI